MGAGIPIVCCVAECYVGCIVGECLPSLGCFVCLPWCSPDVPNPTSSPVCSPFDGPTTPSTPSVPTPSIPNTPPICEANPCGWICGTQTTPLEKLQSMLPNVPNPFSKFGNVLSKAGSSLFGPSTTSTSGSQLGTSLFDLLKCSVSTGVAPGLLLASLGYKCAADYNAKVQGAYNSNMAAMQNYQNMYSSGAGLPQLRIMNQGQPAFAAPGSAVANAPIRTQQNVVARPMARDGGIMSARKNYADGGDVMQSTPMQTGTSDWMSPGIWDSSSVDPTNNNSLEALLKLIEGQQGHIRPLPYPIDRRPTMRPLPYPSDVAPSMSNYAKGGKAKKPAVGIEQLVVKISREPDREEKKGILKTKINQIKKTDPKTFKAIQKLTHNLHLRNAAKLAKQKTYSDTLKKVKLLRMTDPVKHKLLAKSVLKNRRLGQADGSPMEGLDYSTSGNPLQSLLTPSNTPSNMAAIQAQREQELRRRLRGNPALLAKLAQTRNAPTDIKEMNVGGRVGYKDGNNPYVIDGIDGIHNSNILDINPIEKDLQKMAGIPVAAAESIQRLLTSLEPKLARGGIPEIDYRDKGGYVPPIGKKERADDIPAMLSNNEFVFTANAVRNAGKGDLKEGAKKMYKLMKHLEGKK
jgi:hypothetical protein